MATITKSTFGEVEGQLIDLYELSNNRGMTVKIMNYGATITSIKIPVKGETIEVACGFDTLEGYFTEEYRANAPYFGGTIGRYCSQIKDAKFSIDGTEYQLAEMVGKNNLHGGLHGFDKKIWTTEILGNQLVMYLTSHDGEEGFPGNVTARVSFQLTDDNAIDIQYSATTDKATPLAMTNHTYFNLSGFESNVEGFIATVKTDSKQEMDDTGAGTGNILNLDGQPDDLRLGRKIGDVHHDLGDGFEHFYVYDNLDFNLQEVASIFNPDNGLKLTVKSTEPCMLLYTGKYTSDDLRRENGLKYGKYRGFCCETHRYQNGPNIPGSPGTITIPEKPFTSNTIFSFTTN